MMLGHHFILYTPTYLPIVDSPIEALALTTRPPARPACRRIMSVHVSLKLYGINERTPKANERDSAVIDSEARVKRVAVSPNVKKAADMAYGQKFITLHSK